MLHVYHYISVGHPLNILKEHTTICINRKEFFDKLAVWNRTSLKSTDGNVVVYFEDTSKQPEPIKL